MKPTAFRSGTEFREWLARHHASASELILRFYKKDSGLGGITYAEALDEALCHGWIDGVRRSFDATSYTIRFTPRRADSVWSRVNVQHAERLVREGRMHPAGLKAFESRTPERTGVYSFERRLDAFPPDLDALFRKQPKAYAFFNEQPPGYRRIVTAWAASAKRPETRERRLGHLIRASAEGRRLDLMAPLS